MALSRLILFYSFFLSLILACHDKTQNTVINTTKNKINDTIIVDTLSYFTNSLETPPQEVILDKSFLTRANGYLFTGTIDHKYAIELTLMPTKVPSENCQSLSGNYYYTPSKHSISLDGRICLDQQKIYLQHRNKKGLDESFEGTFNSNIDSIQGVWRKTKKQQSLHFELHKVMNLGNTALFIAALSSILSDDAEAPSAQDIGSDEQGIYIQSLAGSHLDYDFHPGDFSATSFYSSTMRNSDYKSGAYLTKLSIRDAYVAVAYNESYNESYEEGKDSEAEPTISKEIGYRVWMYQDDEIVDIFVSKESEAQYPIYATLKENTLIIIDRISLKEQKL
jgi:hypothetical protein